MTVLRVSVSSRVTAFSVFGFRFSVKKTRIISKLKLKLVALETELGINSQDYPALRAARNFQTK